MGEQSPRAEGNPLDDLADEISEVQQESPVELNETMANNVTGGQVTLKQSAARSVRASAAHLQASAAGFVRAGVVDAHESGFGIAIAREMKLEGVNAPLLIAGGIKARKLQTVILLAGRVEGSVKTVLTPLTAMAAGAGFALTLLAIKTVATALVRLSGARSKHDSKSKR